MKDFEFQVRMILHPPPHDWWVGEEGIQAILAAHREELVRELEWAIWNFNGGDEYKDEPTEWLKAPNKRAFDRIQALTHIKEEDTDTDVGIRKE